MIDVPLWQRLAVGMVLALGAAYAATPVAIVTARRLAFYDLPQGYKGHRHPTPYLGGAAVMAAFLAALIVAFPVSLRTLPVLAGVVALWMLGTIDDRRNLSPGLRAGAEFLLGALLTVPGLGWHLGAGGLVDALVDGIWVVAVVNAFNLFDNMDGAASTMAVVASAGTCVLAVLSHDPWAATASVALCGACLGFLPHNLARPARIFLGDGGSMPLGFAVAVLAASAARHAEPSLLSLFTGLLLVGIPALDTSLVIVSRHRRGISILTGGQDHLTHRTRRLLGNARRVALVLGGAQALVSALIIAATRDDGATVVYAVLAFVVCAAAAIVGLDSSPAVATAAPAATQAPSGERTRVVSPASRRPITSAAELRPAGMARLALITIIGLGAGLSPLFSAYYSATVWVPIGLALTLATAATAVARPPRLGLPAGLMLTGIAGLGLWALVSTGWAHAVEQALDDGNLWLVYAVLTLLLVVLVRARRDATVLLAAIGAGIAIVAITVLVRMLGSGVDAMFPGGRLNSPLGYINGEGCFFAMGGWFTLALAERRNAVVAGLGAGATVILAGLGLLSQSRGAALATLAAGVIVCACVPGTRRRILALAAVALGVVAASGPLLDVYRDGQSVLPDAVAHAAVVRLLLCAAVTGALWGAVCGIAGRLRARRGGAEAVLARSATVLATLCIAVPVLVGIVKASSIEHFARTQWHAFVNLSGTTASSTAATQTRLLSGAGNRYDYWRVAWHVFTAHPLAGVGAGNYAPYYYQQRHTQEAIQNPHSIELQMLSELGIVGMALLAALVVGVVVGARRLRRSARVSRADRTLLVAASGVAVVWFVDTSGDWMHLLPGVTAVALAAAVVLCRDPEPEPGGDVPATSPHAMARPATGRPAAAAVARRLAPAAVLAFVVVLAGASLMRSELVQRYLSAAEGELGARPAAAITDADRALRLDGAELDAYYIAAAGQARFDRAPQAKATLLQAAAQDPTAFVTWALLGDLEVRLHDFGAARRYYGRAHTLDPNDATVATLAANPRSALTTGSVAAPRKGAP